MVSEELQAAACRHSLGLTFSRPASWGELRTSDGLILTPPPGPITSGINEAYFIMGEAWPGIIDAFDPRIARSIDQLVRDQFPFVTRQEPPGAVACGRGSGALLKYAGATRSGTAASARVFVSVYHESIIALVALGPVDAVARCEPALRDMFRSFSHRDQELDSPLVGLWRLEGGPAGGDYISTAYHQWEFRADGGFCEHTGHEDAPATREEGLWQAEDDSLLIELEGGERQQFRFRIEDHDGDHRLVLTDPDGLLESWVFVS